AAVAALLGVLAVGDIWAATVALGGIALLGGFWRHLSTDYGPALAVSSALLFLLGLSQRIGGWDAAIHLASLVVLGGFAATLVHIGFWLFRPQHPLRYAVAETWVAVSDLLAAMRTELSGEPNVPMNQTVAAREGELRAALDRTFVILGGAEKKQPSALIVHLEEMRREVVHLAMRVIAFNTSLEPLLKDANLAKFHPVLDSVLKALGDAARSVAISLIVYRPQNFAATSVRLRRCQHLIRVLDERLESLAAECPAANQARVTLHPIALVLPRIAESIGATTEHNPTRFQLPHTLPDLSARSIQSLAAWMNPSPKVDPLLIRHAARVALLTMAAVALYIHFDIPKGHWIAFSMIIVLQPDYGSTRRRAIERIGGTFAGVILASALLWVRTPVYILDLLAAGTSFGFAYYLRTRYAWAVFYVTLLVVLITETTTPVHLDFTIARLVSTLVGGGFALLAALTLWPSWEKRKFPVFLAAALRANGSYLESLRAWITASGPDPLPVTSSLMAKRRAENADRSVAASLERVLAEPAGRQENPVRAAALTTYTQRVTRALTLMTVHLHEGDRPAAASGVDACVGRLLETLELFAAGVEQGYDAPSLVEVSGRLQTLEDEIAQLGRLEAGPTKDWILIQLAKTVAELRAMTLAIQAPGA
ncbi:MAG TPA: FUSC family protein, partial [Candidatus Limnocylindria bacterium]|nr:FUSC family protein [Candidatus Limnocylindria bacterium]